MRCCRPIICPPRYVVRNHYVPRVIPILHPIVNINREVIVNVPRNYYPQVTRNVVVEQGIRPRY